MWTAAIMSSSSTQTRPFSPVIFLGQLLAGENGLVCDYVIIINADKAVLTGKKLTQKYYRTHSGYVGGLKETQYKTLMEKKPCMAMKLAIRGMLPKNSIGRWSLLRCKIYEGEQHNNAAQKPELWAE